ncbi:hypothetical protein B0H15DRAFT_849855 [Mycena belliarum]|uniref:Uncharacterized protein n=1 Tax=Mycena belliarum TaxID=1033014 RepID=A0AAD6U452_9AGAR|nr:hypothetical protein B0H15DRAFT_849855 [Mycena belliae]
MTDDALPPGILPSFTLVPSKHQYSALHGLLWPKGPTSSQPGDLAEPEPLRKCIQAWSPSTVDQGDATAMGVDEDESEPPPPPPEMRYIDLRKHETFRVHLLSGRRRSTFLVRQEYVEFMSHAAQCKEENRRFFLTGQPGIGKSMGACYFLFHLLASGQSVFFIPDTGWIYYFSEAGVQQASTTTTDMGHSLTRQAVERSWILIDVDLGLHETWLPDRWVEPAAGLVWTSSPKASRMHHFTKQLEASTWYMKPWSSQEIAAVVQLDKMDPQDVRYRLSRGGPVARNLFRAPQMASDTSIDNVINVALADNLFTFTTSELVDQGGKASHRVFLVLPQDVFDQAGRPCLNRQEGSFHFLSNYIAGRTSELMEGHADKIRRQLSRAFDNPHTRSAAGKLVESMLHRALIHRKIDLPDTFGGGPVAGQLELVGQAEDFVLETHAPPQRECRPLYLRPQSPSFAAVDAILVTVALLCLIQSSAAASHSHVVKTFLRILTRLKTNKIAVDSLRLLYCVVGTDEGRVKRLVREATEKLTALQADPQARELGKLSQIARERLSKLQVVGFMFDTEKNRLVPVS